MFRALQAAKQLQNARVAGRIVLIVIDEATWFTFQIPLKHKWIDWKNPTFHININDPFIEKKRRRNENLDAELKPTLGSVDAVWILKRSLGNQYEKIFDI